MRTAILFRFDVRSDLMESDEKKIPPKNRRRRDDEEENPTNIGPGVTEEYKKV